MASICLVYIHISPSPFSCPSQEVWYPLRTHIIRTEFFMNSSVNCTMWKAIYLFPDPIYCMPHHPDGILIYGSFWCSSLRSLLVLWKRQIHGQTVSYEPDDVPHRFHFLVDFLRSFKRVIMENFNFLVHAPWFPSRLYVIMTRRCNFVWRTEVILEQIGSTLIWKQNITCLFNIHKREGIYQLVGILELSNYIRKTDERTADVRPCPQNFYGARVFERLLTYTNYYGDDNVCNIYK